MRIIRLLRTKMITLSVCCARSVRSHTFHYTIMKSILFLFLVSCHFLAGYSQDDNIYLRQANIDIDNAQNSFQSAVKKMKMDRGVKNLLLRFLSTGSDSLQNVIKSDAGIPDDKKLLALNSHAYFLKAFQVSLQSGDIDEYQVRELRQAYFNMWDAVRNDKPYDEYLKNMGPVRSKLMAIAFKDYPEGNRIKDLTVISYAQNYPERVPTYLAANPAYTFTDSLIFICANRRPSVLVDFLLKPTSETVRDKIIAHPSPLVQTLVKIAPEKNVKNYLPFAVQLMNNELTLADIDKARQSPSEYFKMLVDFETKSLEQIAEGQSPLYRIPSRNFLKQYALQFYVNPMNVYHEQSNAVRFSGLSNLRTQDLYYVLILGDDIMYTSSYLFAYNKLMEPYKKLGSDSLLRFMRYSQARQFVRLAGRYNTLSSFLEMMPRDTLIRLMKFFISDLEQKSDNGIEEVMNVAESFSSMVKDSTLTALVEFEIASNYLRCEQLPNFYGMKLYRILDQMMAAVKASETGEKIEVDERLSSYLRLPIKSLQDKNDQVNELVLFYGDEDGISSYHSFMTSFTDTSLWKIEKNEFWLSITSKKFNPVNIYANLPLSNDEDLDKKAQDTLVKFLRQQNIHPHVIIHRGHSYHLLGSVQYIDSAVFLAILGSCGGYNEIFEVQRRSNEAQVISTKQVGSKLVNEPMIKIINDYFLQRKDIVWTELWELLDKGFKNNAKARTLFQDYVPPNKNIGLQVARIYNEEMGD